MAGEERSDATIITGEMVRRLNEYSNRIKNVEQRLERIESRIETLEDTAINRMGDLKINLEKLSQKISSVSDRLSLIENEILRMNKELGKTALKSDIKRIETFIDIVNPITSKFITRDEVERLLEEEKEKKA